MDDRRQLANRHRSGWALSGPPSAIEFRNRWEMPMAARKKSGSRKSAAKKTAKTRKPRAKAKKAAKAPKRRVAAKKTVRARKPRVAAKKPVATPRTAVAPPAPPPAPVTEVDNRIAIVRANLRELVDQAASSAGAANEELLSQRIAEQEERLRLLMQERDNLAR